LKLFKIQRTLLYALFPILIINCNNSKSSVNDEKTRAQNDSISILIKRSKNKKHPLQYRKNNLHKAYNFNKNQKNDSLKNKALLEISYIAYKLMDSSFFKKTNKEAYQLSYKLKDYFSIADTYWNNGLFFFKKEILDSAYTNYYKAFKLYEQLNQLKKSGIMLHNMAIIQNNIKDYTGSEILSFQAISKFNKEKHHINLYRCYNNLGIIYNNINEFEKAIKYHNIALKHLANVINKKTLQEGSLNNIGLVHQKKSKHNDAIKHFKQALKNTSLKKNNPNLYAKLIDNLAYSRLLNNDTVNIRQEFYKARRIRDSLKFISGVLISDLHLSEYYRYKKDTIKAIKYAKESLSLAKNVHNNRDHLAALKLLSEIDPKNATKHLTNYLSLSDSLHHNERKLRNKFARIRFETDEYIEEVNKQSSEKVMIATISFSTITILLLLYFVRHQRSKNRELQLETAQQHANENFYNLLLKQQSKLEEGRLNERLRISQELHDGVLGKIFATRMRLDFLDIKGTNEMQQKFQLYLEELQGIEKEIRVISHELKNELLSNKSDFIQIIEHLVMEQSALLNFRYQIEEKDNLDWNRITDVVKINCYRIIQEALQNINKHSKANNVSIQFSISNNILLLNIKDDGIGFDVKKHKTGIGLQNIADRVKKLNGTFVTTSNLGQGSLLRIHIPI